MAKKEQHNENEARLQARCFQYHWNNFPAERRRLFMIHNNPKNEIDGARLRAMGLVKGAADMCYLRVGMPPLFLEFKDIHRGRQSKDQVEFEMMCVETSCGYVVIRSFEEFLSAIDKPIPEES